MYCADLVILRDQPFDFVTAGGHKTCPFRTKLAAIFLLIYERMSYVGLRIYGMKELLYPEVTWRGLRFAHLQDAAGEIVGVRSPHSE